MIAYHRSCTSSIVKKVEIRLLALSNGIQHTKIRESRISGVEVEQGGYASHFVLENVIFDCENLLFTISSCQYANMTLTTNSNLLRVTFYSASAAAAAAAFLAARSGSTSPPARV